MRSFAACLLVAVFAVALLPSAGFARDDLRVKFSVNEWRLDAYPAPAVEGQPARLEYVLKLFSSSAKAGGDDNLDLEWEAKNPTLWLDLLQSCGSGRLYGELEADERDRSGKKIEGKGPIAEMHCRKPLR